MIRDIRSRLVPAWLLTAAVDGIFASALSVYGYHGTFARLWQGVASTVLGPASMQGGTRTVMIGLLMHLGVALLWTSVFFALYTASAAVRRIVATPGGVVAAAAIYGPPIWLVMSLLVIPALTGRPPAITPRWWINLVAHVPFVALPMIWVIGRGVRVTPPLADARVAESAA